MSGCCGNDSHAIALREKQKGTLVVVLVINAAMFVVILVGAQLADSSALFADCLDNLGDALTYAVSLLVVSRGTASKAWVALFKGGLIFLVACLVGLQIVQHLIYSSSPVFELMGGFSVAGLMANGCCLWLLTRHRDDDINMSSVWECSRNDLVSNISVLAAAGLVWLAQANWPDLLVAAVLTLFLLRSSIRVIGTACTELRQANRHLRQE